MSGVREITGAGDGFGTGGGEGEDTFTAGGVTGGASLGNDAIGSGGNFTGCVDVGVTGAAQAAARTTTPRDKSPTILFVFIPSLSSTILSNKA